jgi:hypothetical protein
MPPTVETTPLRQLAPGLWDVEQLRRMAGANQRLRMTVVALTGGGLWLYSPVEIDDDLRFDGVLGSEPSGLPWASDLDTLVLTSVPRFSETVFFHRASRTLICADLFFNIRTEQSCMSHGDVLDQHAGAVLADVVAPFRR